jgi:hypothetical protein
LPESWAVKNGILASLGAARGVIYTNESFGRYRIIFDVRHNSGKPDQRALTQGQKPLDALGAIQF